MSLGRLLPIPHALCKRFSVKNYASLNCALQKAGYKSRYSLENVYPNSSLSITKLPNRSAVQQSAKITFSGYIPLNELIMTHSASSGPGGQNVNKVHTKVDLRFHVDSATWLSEVVKSNVIERYRSMITKEGFLVVKSDRTRYQSLNIADCLDKLRFMIREAEKRPSEPSLEDETLNLARHEKAARERLREKRSKSLVKQNRQGPLVDY